MMTDQEHLKLYGWLPVAVLADGTVIIWSWPGDAQSQHYSTPEAAAAQAKRDRQGPQLFDEETT